MNYRAINSVYFIGIGGIGMSALARYFKSQGKTVSGYDKTETELTKSLVSEGIKVHYTDLGSGATGAFNTADCLVIYTPAIPKDHKELNAFRDHGFKVVKRAEALGVISHSFETFAVAGTHGKTTTSTMLAHVLNQTPEGCNAFIGGISSNYNSNCILNAESDRVVVEADEFDRSFLTLRPNYAIVTSMDADHLDIYGDGDHLIQSFNDFINCVNPEGILMINSSLDISRFNIDKQLKRFTYGFGADADWRGANARSEEGKFYFDINTQQDLYPNVELGLPGKHNAENALAVFALCTELNVPEKIIREALASFKGVKRRFEFLIRRDDLIFIDDYAHHPTEINAFLSSVRQLFPDKQITTVFQPHLYSRTRDFMEGFGESLSLSDEVILLPVYPAREEPIEGITSEALFDKISIEQKSISSLKNIVEDLKSKRREVILTVGAGDIDTCVKPILKAYE